MSQAGYDAFFKAAQEAKKSPSRQKKSSKKGKSEKASSRRELKDYSEADLRKMFKLGPEPRRKRAQHEVSILGLAGVCLCMAVMSTLFLFPEEVERLWSKVDIGIMTMATAEDQEKTSTEPKPPSAENANAKAPAETGEQSKSENWTSQDMSYFAKLNERKKELDLREKELDQLEEELHKQKSEIEARIRTLSEIRRNIAGVLQERVSVDEGKVDKLVEFYSSMKPSQAAEILGSIDEDLAVSVLGKMKKKDAAEIMNLLEPKKARALSEKFAGYKRR